MTGVNDVLAIILGGGRGTRLWPLTQQRSKPAVPIAGKYRLIDIPISNCINSGIYRISVLTQFNSVSLHRHISRTYQFDAFHSGWVQIWAAEQTMENTDWYQGTADAVRKQRLEIFSTRAENVLILAGDHLYRMDYEPMIRYHTENDADITVAVQPVARQDAGRFGILKRDPSGQITSFAEKPRDPAIQANLVSRDDPERPFLGSMGIYLFKTRVMFELLSNPELEDFGGDVIPFAINTYSVFGFDYDGFWEDIGTIRSFYETNLALARQDTPFNFFDPEKPIYTRPRFLPGSVLSSSVCENAMIAEGCSIVNSTIKHSVIGIRSQIRSGCTVANTVMMGSDYYDRTIPGYPGELLPIGMGTNCQIDGAIIDKNARIGNDVIIRPFPAGTDINGDNWVVRDGIVVIPKNAILQTGTYIGPDRE